MYEKGILPPKREFYFAPSPPPLLTSRSKTKGLINCGYGNTKKMLKNTFKKRTHFFSCNTKLTQNVPENSLPKWEECQFLNFPPLLIPFPCLFIANWVWGANCPLFLFLQTGFYNWSTGDSISVTAAAVAVNDQNWGKEAVGKGDLPTVQPIT